MGSCAAPSAKGDDKFITTDYLQQCPIFYRRSTALLTLSKANNFFQQGRAIGALRANLTT
ncbi:hypothetical protein ACS4Y6_25035, partial [Salmonella enterica]|uniref:hypothetical protein n=1 Tax=Salmonella enterica TaxID=28901 RepID=UPI003F433EB7